MSLFKIINNILNHPININNKLKAILCFAKWQLGSRILNCPVSVPFVNESRLLVQTGMTGATGNIYNGLHEFEDMAFLLHFLRPKDLFLDIGSNVGSYTVLASAVVGSQSISIEPIPDTYQILLQNIRLNGIDPLCKCYNIGISSKIGKLPFTTNLDSMNHVVNNKTLTANTCMVTVTTLDKLLISHSFPILIKIDVEGHHAEIIKGATKTLSNPNVIALIIEYESMNMIYKQNSYVHSVITNYKFMPYKYLPFEKILIPLKTYNTTRNTIYIKDISFAKQRIESSSIFNINTLTSSMRI